MQNRKHYAQKTSNPRRKKKPTNQRSSSIERTGAQASGHKHKSFAEVLKLLGKLFRGFACCCFSLIPHPTPLSVNSRSFLPAGKVVSVPSVFRSRVSPRPYCTPVGRSSVPRWTWPLDGWRESVQFVSCEYKWTRFQGQARVRVALFDVS